MKKLCLNSSQTYGTCEARGRGARVGHEGSQAKGQVTCRLGQRLAFRIVTPLKTQGTWCVTLETPKGKIIWKKNWDVIRQRKEISFHFLTKCVCFNFNSWPCKLDRCLLGYSTVPNDISQWIYPSSPPNWVHSPPPDRSQGTHDLP